MKTYFIIASGTGIGKTLVTSALAHQLRARGTAAQAIKPVISGFDAQDAAGSDTGILLAAQGMALTPESIDAISPWRFAAPLSPDMAAEDEGREIDLEQLMLFCREQRNTDILLIEGAGGVMTPLGREHTMLDWAKALDAPVILVAGSYLGALSHTLASARVITEAGLALHGVVVSESETQPVTLERTLATLARFLPAVRMAAISRLDSCAELWKYAPDLLTSLAL